MVHRIADTGFIVALHDKNPAVAKATRSLFADIGKPLLTCEAVLTEAAWMLSPALIARMVEDGDLQVRFAAQHIGRLRELLEKYKARMAFADACVVRMSELFPSSVI